SPQQEGPGGAPPQMPMPPRLMTPEDILRGHILATTITRHDQNHSTAIQEPALASYGECHPLYYKNEASNPAQDCPPATRWWPH
ncbi:unnamed protein product, partial [Amoebophrya sp. A25]